LIWAAGIAGAAAAEPAGAPGWSALRHLPSAMPMTPWRGPDGDKPFAAYAADTAAALDAARQRIEPDAEGRARAVAQVAPREWPLDPACGGKAAAGVLLVHGLSDTPFLMADLGDALARLPGRCLLVRSILLPGHGSVPGDLVRPTADEWRAAVRYGVDSFQGVADRVHVAGFSTGGALALDLVLTQPPTRPAVASLVLLSPAVGLANRLPLHRIPYGFEAFAWVMRAFAGFSPAGDWLRIGEDIDFAKAESFPVMAPKPLMQVMDAVEHAKRPVPVPVFMAFSAEDATVESAASLAFFRNRVIDPASRLVLYAAPATLVARAADLGGLDAADSRIRCVHGAGPNDRGCTIDAARIEPCAFGPAGGTCITAISHTGLPVSPANPHYGATGDYRNCLAYAEAKRWDSYCACVTPAQRTASPVCHAVTPAPVEAIRLGELIKVDPAAPAGRLTARLGYNPDFDQMVADIAVFLP